MATDVYKLEWTRSRSTIQTGVSAIMAREAFMDTIVVCRDGAVTHNKLTLGLVFPELHKVGGIVVEHRHHYWCNDQQHRTTAMLFQKNGSSRTTNTTTAAHQQLYNHLNTSTQS